MVYLRDYGIRGRHKIQDLWSPVVYKVVEAPRSGGAVYSIAPIHEEGKVKRVHRSLLKARIQRNPTHVVPDGPVGELEQEPAEEVDEADLWLVRPEGPQLVLDSVDSAPSVPVFGVPGEQHQPCGMVVGPVLSPGTSAMEQAPVEVCPVLSPGSSAMEQLPAAEVVPGRPRRATAGQHSNIHRLPRAVVETVMVAVPPGLMSNTILAFFRPWD